MEPGHNVDDLVHNLISRDMHKFNKLILASAPQQLKATPHGLIASASVWNSLRQKKRKDQDQDNDWKQEDNNGIINVRPPSCMHVATAKKDLAHEARAALTQCLIAEHAVMQSQDTDLEPAMAVYLEALSTLEDAVRKATSIQMYDALLNQVAHKAEMRDIQYYQNRLSEKRSKAVSQMSTRQGQEAASAVAEFLQTTEDAQELLQERMYTSMTEIRQIILNPPSFHKESEMQTVKRLQNLATKERVKDALLSRAECMKRKKKELVALAKAGGHMGASPLTKDQLCDYLDQEKPGVDALLDLPLGASPPLEKSSIPESGPNQSSSILEVLPGSLGQSTPDIKVVQVVINKKSKKSKDDD